MRLTSQGLKVDNLEIQETGLGCAHHRAWNPRHGGCGKGASEIPRLELVTCPAIMNSFSVRQVAMAVGRIAAHRAIILLVRGPLSVPRLWLQTSVLNRRTAGTDD